MALAPRVAGAALAPRIAAAALTPLVAAVALVAAAAPAHADQVRDAQWHVPQLDLATAHATTRGEGVTIAVIDSGVDARHPDLRDNLLPGVDLVEPANDNAWTPEDHGTLVAGVLAGHGHGPGGADGVIGVAPGATVLPIRAAADADDQPTSRLVADAIGHAVAAGADVISISLSSDHNGPDERAIEAARRADVVVVAAAGNQPDAEEVTFPAALPTVLAVGAVAQDGGVAEFSVTGPELTLTAPGDEIVTTRPGNEYAVASGTSFAAPVVAGAAALVRARFPQLTADEVSYRLVATAADAGPPGQDEQYGHGVVDVVAALTAELPPMPPVLDEPDQIRRDQQHLAALDLAAAHEISRGDGVTVAVVGSGVDADHPDLHHNLLPGVDLAEPENPDGVSAPGASGTALAGLVSGHGNRLTDHEPGNRGALGVAPAATILPIRVTGGDHTDQEAAALAAEGIARAVAEGARVVLYAGVIASQDLFADAVDAATAADALVVAAVEDRPDWFPAAHPAVLAVTSTGQPAGPPLTAPGDGLLTTAPGGGYAEENQPSAGAAALVAGAAALVRAAFPELTAREVSHRLVATADAQGSLDLVAALTADVPPPPATATPAPPGTAPPPSSAPGFPAGWAAALGGAVALLAGAAAAVSYRRWRRRRPE